MVPKDGRKLIANLIRGRGVLVHARLAKVDPIPADEDVTLADLTECDFDGYTPILLNDFPAPTIDGSDTAVMVSPLKTWTAGLAIAGPQTLYVTYVTCGDPMAADADEILFFERILPAPTLASPGEQFQRYIRWRDTNWSA